MAEQGTHKPLVGSSNLPVATDPIVHLFKVRWENRVALGWKPGNPVAFYC